MTVRILRQRNEGEIGPEFDGALEITARKSVVDEERRPGGMSGRCDCGDVDDLETGIGRRLDPDEGRTQ